MAHQVRERAIKTDNSLFVFWCPHACHGTPQKYKFTQQENVCFDSFFQNHSDVHPSDPKLLDIECAVVSKQMSSSDLRVPETEHKLELASHEPS